MKLILLVLTFCSAVCFAQTKTPGDYPQASDELLGNRFLEDYSEDDLSLMRNEIFARYGYIFKKPELREHFSEQAWYKPSVKDINVITAKLTEIEKHNIQLILAREATLKPVAVRKLPRISLPLNLEDASWSDFRNVTDIAPHSGKDSPTAIVGMLADTSRYFAVLWYQNQVSLDMEHPERVYYITTYTKTLKEIATAAVSLNIGRNAAYGATDCSNQNYSHASYINENLTYNSEWSWEAKCAEDTEYERANYQVNGQLRSDGTIHVIRNGY